MNKSVDPEHPLELTCEELDIWLYLALLPDQFDQGLFMLIRRPLVLLKRVFVSQKKTEIVFMSCDLRWMNERISQTTEL